MLFSLFSFVLRSAILLGSRSAPPPPWFWTLWKVKGEGEAPKWPKFMMGTKHRENKGAKKGQNSIWSKTGHLQICRRQCKQHRGGDEGQAKENDDVTAEGKGSKAKADNLTTEAKGSKAKADNLTTEAKGGKAREANFTAEKTRNDKTEVDETGDRSEAETREGTLEIMTKKTTMITEQGRGFPFQLGREIPRNDIKMIVSQTTETGNSDKYDRTRDRRSVGELPRMHQLGKATLQR